MTSLGSVKIDGLAGEIVVLKYRQLRRNAHTSYSSKWSTIKRCISSGRMRRVVPGMMRFSLNKVVESRDGTQSTLGGQVVRSNASEVRLVIEQVT